MCAVPGAFEVRSIQQVEVVVVPSVIGTLGTVSKDCQVAGVPRYTRDSRYIGFREQFNAEFPRQVMNFPI